METMTIYIANGKRFDDPQEALYYERLCSRVSDIMDKLKPRTDAIENLQSFNKHDVLVLQKCFNDFCLLCAECIPSCRGWFIDVTRGKRHKSHIDKILSDYSHRFPVLHDTMFRFMCCSFDNGYEFGQPYFVNNQEEFFTGRAKRIKDI